MCCVAAKVSDVCLERRVSSSAARRFVIADMPKREVPLVKVYYGKSSKNNLHSDNLCLSDEESVWLST
jgi:hypothetical protein